MKQLIIETLGNWDPEMKLTVTARFIRKGSDEPVTGPQYKVKLYDRDTFDDDFLGTSDLNENGEASISFYPEDFRTFDSGIETLPDLYLLLFDDTTVHFQTKVWDDVDFVHNGKFDPQNGEVIDFGTFLVD